MVVAASLLDQRDDQAEVGADDLVSDLQRLGLEGPHQVEVRVPYFGWVDRAPQPRGLMFEEVHFSKQVHLLLASQEPFAIDAKQDPGDVRWGLDRSDVRAPRNSRRLVEDH